MRMRYVLLSTVVIGVLLWLFRGQFEPLAGYDFNRNGVRDDIEEYIDKNSKTPRIRIAAYEVARNYQKNILNPKSPYEPAMKSVSCLLSETLASGQDGMELLSEIQTRMGNTLERQRALIKYSSQFNGQILIDQDRFGAPCVYDR